MYHDPYQQIWTGLTSWDGWIENCLVIAVTLCLCFAARIKKILRGLLSTKPIYCMNFAI